MEGQRTRPCLMDQPGDSNAPPSDNKSTTKPLVRANSNSVMNTTKKTKLNRADSSTEVEDMEDSEASDTERYATPTAQN